MAESQSSRLRYSSFGGVSGVVVREAFGFQVCHDDGRSDPPRCRRTARASPPATSGSTPDTQNDRIDADIQLAGVKPMSFPKDVHADAHQDTYPGLMSL